MSHTFAKQGIASARQFARTYGVKDKAEIAAIAAQFEYDLRKHEELREMSLCAS